MKTTLFLLSTIGLIAIYGACSAPPGNRAIQDSLHVPENGSTAALGWIHKHIQEDYENGWIANVEEMSLDGDWWQSPGRKEIKGSYGKAPFYQPYIDHLGAHAAGEYQAHWLDNLITMGWDCGEDACRKKADEAVAAILANLPENGYLGVVRPEEQFTDVSVELSEYELWSYGENLHALLLYYQRTGNKEVLDACIKAADLFVNTFDPQVEGHREMYGLWWSSIIYSLCTLYDYTGNSRYLRISESMIPNFLKSLHRIHSYWDTESLKKNPVLRGHTAGIVIWMRAELELYRRTGDATLLENIRLIEQQVMTQHLQPNGSPSGHGEHLAGKGPYVHMELCDPFWWTWHWTEMLKLTGDPHYADLAEKAAFNAMPSARSKDGNAIQYMSCQNQLTTSRNVDHGKVAHSIRQVWDCCHSNGPRILPILVGNAVLQDSDGGVRIVYYGPTSARLQIQNADVQLVQKTNYPFEETIRIAVKTDKPVRFPLRLRVPDWCKKAAAQIAGKVVGEKSGDWLLIDRQWRDGDVLEFHVPMEVKVARHRFNTDIRLIPEKQRDGDWAEAVTVERGPLLYSLSVPIASKVPTPTMGKQRGAFEARAAAEGPWNYALVVDTANPATSFQVVYLPVDSGYVWQHSPVALEVKAVRVPDWKCSETQLDGRVAPEVWRKWSPAARRRWQERRWLAPDLPPPGFTVAETKETLRLIPLGFTLLRMTYLPSVAD